MMGANFTAEAQAMWVAIPPEIRKRLTRNVWCVQCSSETTIRKAWRFVSHNASVPISQDRESASLQVSEGSGSELGTGQLPTHGQIRCLLRGVGRQHAVIAHAAD